MTTEKRKQYLITILCLAVVALGAWYFVQLTGGYSGKEAVWIHIPQGATAEEAEDSIKSALGERFGSRVAMLWNDDVEASRGAYRVEPDEKAWKVARRLNQGRQTPVRVTFNNVRTFNDLANRLAAKMDFTADDFTKAATKVAGEDSISFEQLEAEMLPDTYETYWTDSPEQLIGRIRQNYNRFWTAERTAKARASGLTKLDASILASIVEEESNRADERGTIARLYLNRLHRGMKLQADPTVRFAKGDFTIKRVTDDMLNIQSPYNTYVVNGLPPGVIRFPEARTIDRVLDAPQHDYIYMCARPDGSGYHDFTASYSDHLANARTYRARTYGAKK